jgi:hypothetical protein
MPALFLIRYRTSISGMEIFVKTRIILKFRLI